MEPAADIIRAIPIFSALSREDIAKVLGKMEETAIEAGTTIFSQGDQGDAFYLIQSGAVEVMLESGAGKSEVIAVLGPKDWFGEMALLTGEPRSATIFAVKPTILWRLSREAWDDLIDKHPTWLLQFCATLSKRLSYLDRQYSTGREAFDSLAEEFYSALPPQEQELFRRACLLNIIDIDHVEKLLGRQGAHSFLTDLEKSQFRLIRHLEGSKYQFHGFFKEFLAGKLLAAEGEDGLRVLHTHLAACYEALGDWREAIDHALKGGEWAKAAALMVAREGELLNGDALFVKDAIDGLPREQLHHDNRLVHLKAAALAQLGDEAGAVRIYKETLAARADGSLAAELIDRHIRIADALAQRREYSQALTHLRGALDIAGQESATANMSAEGSVLYSDANKAPEAYQPGAARLVGSIASKFLGRSPAALKSYAASKWFGAALGLATWAYLWFGQPEIGLDQGGTRLLALLSLTLIYWVFWVLPDYGVAFIFALGLILSGLASRETVLGGFSSTTWFMTLGVLGLGAAITGSGLFYRLSLHLVRFFPLSFYWQVAGMGLMGVVVMALIPQQTARTVVISQMLVNLSESLGYKTPSKASTGLFAASFLGLGQLGFLFLTGSTTSLIAWGLLPADVRSQFTWGYWFLAAAPPALIVLAIILAAITLIYRPESEPKISYKMVQTQLEVLGPLSGKEWISLAVLIFTVTGWLTISYHGIDGAWIALIAFCVLVNTGVLGWQNLKKAIDWELLLYMGVTLSIPALLTQARIDQWLVELINPVLEPFLDHPAWFFLAIAALTYALKLFFTSFLTVVTLSVALVPLSIDTGMSPWIIAMIVLMASEVWFFPFQVDWHTMAYSTTEKKGFSYPLMCRLNPAYALAYIVAMIAAIPYWRYLGLMG
jgi:anion transporter